MKIKKIGRWIVVAVVMLVLSFLFTGNNSIIKLYSSHLDVKKKQQEIRKKKPGNRFPYPGNKKT